METSLGGTTRGILGGFLGRVLSELVGELFKTVMVFIRSDLLDHLPTQLSGKSSIEIPFTIMFHFSFLSCHALTPNFLGCPGAHGMHYTISKTLVLIYLHAYININ